MKISLIAYALIIILACFFEQGCSNLPSFRSNEDRCFDLCGKSATEETRSCATNIYDKKNYACDCKCPSGRD